MLKKKADSKEVEQVNRQVQLYLTKERQFLCKLIVCMHVTRGQPIHRPKLGLIKVNNSVYLARNIYVINRQMCFLTMYNKAQKRQGNTKYIVQCLLEEVGQILAQYLVRVRPFVQALDQRELEYLFANRHRPQAREELSQALGTTTRKQLGVQLTVLSQRHVAISIATQHLIQASKIQEKENEDVKNGDKEFVEGDNKEELELDTFQHIIVRQVVG